MTSVAVEIDVHRKYRQSHWHIGSLIQHVLRIPVKPQNVQRGMWAMVHVINQVLLIDVLVFVDLSSIF